MRSATGTEIRLGMSTGALAMALLLVGCGDSRTRAAQLAPPPSVQEKLNNVTGGGGTTAPTGPVGVGRPGMAPPGSPGTAPGGYPPGPPTGPR